MMNHVEMLAQIRAAETSRLIAEAERLRGAKLRTRPVERRRAGLPSLAARAWAAFARRAHKA